VSSGSSVARSEGRVTSPARVVAVTAGLSVFGAVVGAGAGATALFLGSLLTGQPLLGGPFALLALPAVIGAALGSVLTPIAGWMLLRRVPLGRAFAGLALGTIGGGALGWFGLNMLARFSVIRGNVDPIVGPVSAAVAGFLVAAVAMRYSKRARVAAGE
jgi:hypothetical protein